MHGPDPGWLEWLGWLRRLRPGRERRWFLVPLAAGLLVLIATLALAPGASRVDGDPPLPVVTVLAIRPVTVQPELDGYGQIRAAHTWQGLAQVAGRVARQHPELRVGAWFPAGAVLVEIDPRDYELAVTRAEAQVRAADAALAELDARLGDLTVSRDLEAQALGIATRDFARRERLAASGHIAAIELDAEAQQLLRQRQGLQTLEAQLNLIPTQRTAIAAQQQEAQTLVARAREDLARTRIEMPFDGRIVELGSEPSQFVPVGQALVVAATTDAMEAVLEVPMEELITRFPWAGPGLRSIAAGSDASRSGTAGTSDPHALAALRADITYDAGDLALQWTGRVVRIDPALNPQSRAARIFIEVTPTPDQTPPAGNLYARIRLSGPPLRGQVVIPRLAAQSTDTTHVWLIDAEGRLERREIEIAFRQGDLLVVARGVAPGEKLLLTALPYATPGMRVAIAEMPAPAPAPAPAPTPTP